ncbi:hypothetical protein QFC22_005619 [Naganishia vaughanmartiniae]|uniref:Uncharacterized protein n=1 Tax=Naganishia vaughanmartiniae TaxID=1424756 RepID=A0ACC2WSK3_9TREE|nr:hypothetical protein QFC22_005619 [Naganishia vaughanmartiniae]
MPNPPSSSTAAHPLAASGQPVTTGTSTTENGRQVDETGRPLLPWAFIDCDTEDLVVLIAHMLNKLMEHNDQVVLTSSSLTRFHSRAPPAITVIDYLRRIVKYTNLERLPLLSLLAYIDITCAALPTFTLSSLTVHRFLIAGVTAGSKALCDVFCTNAHYAKVGGIKVNELNALERELVKVTDWNLCVHAELLQQYYTSLIRSHGEYAQSVQPSASPFTAFPLPDPEEGLFTKLEIELKTRAGNRDKATGPAGKDPMMGRVDGKTDCAEDDEMDGTHRSKLDTVAAGSGMDIDGDATGEGEAVSSSSLPRIQQQQSRQQIITSSPHSSDTTSSSLIGTSSGSVFASGMDVLSTSHNINHHNSLHDRSLHPPSIPTDIVSSGSSRSTSAYSSPQTQATGSGSMLSTSLKSTYTGNASSRTSRARRLSKSAIPFPMSMTSTPASPRVDKTSAGAEDIVAGGGAGDGVLKDVQTAIEGHGEYGGNAQMMQGLVTNSRPSPAHRKISIVHEQAMAEASQREIVSQQANMETDEVAGHKTQPREKQSERGRRASSPAISTQTHMRGVREERDPDSKTFGLSESTILAVLPSGLHHPVDSPLPHHQQRQSATVSQPARFKRFMGSLFRSKSVSSDLGRDIGVISPTAVPEDRQAGSPNFPLSTVTTNSSVAMPSHTISPRRARSMLPPGAPHNTSDLRGDRSSTVTLSKSPRDVSTHASAHPGSVTPRIRTRCERSTSPAARTLHDSTMDLEMDTESTVGGRPRFSHSPKRSRTSVDTVGESSSVSSEAGSTTSQSSVPGKTDRLASSTAVSKGNQSGGNVSAIDWKCRSASTAGFDGVVDGLGVG